MANDKKKATHVVKSEFRDVNNFDTVYAVGDDVSDLDKDRLAKLVTNGLVTDVEAEAAAAKAKEGDPK